MWNSVFHWSWWMHNKFSSITTNMHMDKHFHFLCWDICRVLGRWVSISQATNNGIITCWIVCASAFTPNPPHALVYTIDWFFPNDVDPNDSGIVIGNMLLQTFHTAWYRYFCILHDTPFPFSCDTRVDRNGMHLNHTAGFIIGLRHTCHGCRERESELFAHAVTIYI